MQVGVERVVQLRVLVGVEAVRPEVDEALHAGAREAGPAVVQAEVEVLLAGGDVAKGEEAVAQGQEDRIDFVWMQGQSQSHVAAEKEDGVGEDLAVGIGDQYQLPVWVCIQPTIQILTK